MCPRAPFTNLDPYWSGGTLYITGHSIGDGRVARAKVQGTLPDDGPGNPAGISHRHRSFSAAGGFELTGEFMIVSDYGR